MLSSEVINGERNSEEKERGGGQIYLGSFISDKHMAITIPEEKLTGRTALFGELRNQFGGRIMRLITPTYQRGYRKLPTDIRDVVLLRRAYRRFTGIRWRIGDAESLWVDACMICILEFNGFKKDRSPR